MSIVISPTIRDKLALKHNVTTEEVEQCFANRNGEYIEETRATHQTYPVTQYFIAETNFGRKLKVCYVPEHGNLYIKTAFEAGPAEIHRYLAAGGKTV